MSNADNETKNDDTYEDNYLDGVDQQFLDMLSEVIETHHTTFKGLVENDTE